MKRIQRQRTKGWRMPEGAVYVGRPSPWGNPYRAGQIRGGMGVGDDMSDTAPMTAADAVERYRRVVSRRFDLDHPQGWLAPLRGRDLVCWCPLPCGVDVDLGWGPFGGPYDPCALPAGHDGNHDPSEQPAWCHADVLLELANR